MVAFRKREISVGRESACTEMRVRRRGQGDTSVGGCGLLRGTSTDGAMTGEVELTFYNSVGLIACQVLLRIGIHSNGETLPGLQNLY